MGNRYVILGLGVSGKSVADYCLDKKWDCVAVDQNVESLRSRFPHLPIYPEQGFELEKNDILVKSPGIPPTHLLVLQARQKEIKITSELELGLEAMRHKEAKVFAITGSNGKTTTTLLTEHVLSKAGKKVLACGNVGTPLLTLISQDIDFYVLEISSFQLEMLDAPYFDAAVILNITPNHLDRHTSYEEYVRAKFQIAHCLKAKAPLFLRKKERLCYSSFLPQGKTVSPLEESIDSFSLLRYRDKRRVMEEENLQAACALSRLAGLSEEEFIQGYLSFGGLPHRREYVGTSRGIQFINDSKATTVSAVHHALDALPPPLLLIMGGIDKGGDFAELHPIIKNKVKRVFAIGKAASKIAEVLGPVVAVEKLPDLKAAFERSLEFAKTGDTILLSPACSSYDQFLDYQQRGETFKQLVHEWEKKP